MNTNEGLHELILPGIKIRVLNVIKRQIVRGARVTSD